MGVTKKYLLDHGICLFCLEHPVIPAIPDGDHPIIYQCCWNCAWLAGRVGHQEMRRCAGIPVEGFAEP